VILDWRFWILARTRVQGDGISCFFSLFNECPPSRHKIRLNSKSNMSELKRIFSKSYQYTMYEYEGNFILTTVCGLVGLFTIEVQLSREEEIKLSKKGEKFISSLASDISSQPDKYAKRKIPNNHAYYSAMDEERKGS